MYKIINVSILLLFFFSSQATIYQVGTTKTYSSPNELYQANVVSDGDTVYIDAETYSGQASLAVWAANDILIEGVGGKPHLKADGKYIWGKGIMVAAGNNITFENIEFSGAAVPDKNGAAIRLDGNGLTVRNCYFHDNENGILTNNSNLGVVFIEYCEFNHNGYGDGYSHNLYIGHVEKLIFKHNYTHHAVIGHNLKSRANENFILYNRIMDEETGVSSRLIDLPNGGFSIVMGNVMMQGPNAENNNLIGYGLEGLTNPSNELYVINNTMVNKRAASCIFVDIKDGVDAAVVSNNIFTGTGTLIKGSTTAFDNNLADETISNIKFGNEPEYKYTLKSNSPAIDYGIALDSVNGHSLVPMFIYEVPFYSDNFRVIDNIIDAGAYEYLSPVLLENLSFDIQLYPNPTSGFIQIKSENYDLHSFEIFSLQGQLLRSELLEKKNVIDVTELKKGVYLIKVNAGKLSKQKLFVVM